jgi:hypothetical protein
MLASQLAWQEAAQRSPLFHLPRVGRGPHVSMHCIELNTRFLFPLSEDEGQAVTQLFEALRYKSEGRGFDSRCHWNFSLTSFRPHYARGLGLASNRSEY